MPDLIAVYDSEGKCIGKCGYSCYAAQKPECKCICGGENHGIGFKRAMSQSAAITEAIIEKGGKGTDARNQSKDLKLVDFKTFDFDEELASHFYEKVVVLPDKEKK